MRAMNSRAVTVSFAGSPKKGEKGEEEEGEGMEGEGGEGGNVFQQV